MPSGIGAATPAHNNTTIDLNDYGSLKKDSSSQPLIRAIKGELLKLSQSTRGKTRIQELDSNFGGGGDGLGDTNC